MKSGELDNIRNEFRKAWPTLIRDIRDHKQFSDILDSSEWFTKVLEENVPFGKQNRYGSFQFLLPFFKACIKDYNWKLSHKA
jgi:hypothetical protein